MKKMIIKLESFEEMLQWGHEFARMVDLGEPIPETCIRSFEDPEDLFALFSPSRRELLAEIQKQPGPIEEIASRLHRKVAEVERDVSILADAEVVTTGDNWVMPIAEEIVFEENLR